MPEKTLQFNMQPTADELQNRLFVMEQRLQNKSLIIDEILNKKPPQIDLATNSQMFDLVKNEGPNGTTFFLNDKNPDGAENFAPGGAGGGGIPTAPPARSYCWFRAEYVYDDGDWLSPVTSFGCAELDDDNKLGTADEGWIVGEEGESYAVWAAAGGVCNAEEDCTNWAADITPPEKPPWDGDSVSEGNTSKSSSDSSSEDVSISESSSESSTAELVSACQDGEALCDGQECDDGRSNSIAVLDYDTCNSIFEGFMANLAEYCEDTDNGTWKLCGYKDYQPCTYDGFAYAAQVTSCCCELETCPPFVSISDLTPSQLSGTVNLGNYTTCESLEFSFTNSIGFGYCEKCTASWTTPYGTYSKTVGAGEGTASWADYVSAVGAPATTVLLTGENATCTMTASSLPDGVRLASRGDTRLTAAYSES